MSKSMTFNVEELKQYVVQFLRAHEIPEIEARIAADVLVSADMRGIASHGVIRLHSYYGDGLRRGKINPESPITTINESAATLALDGGNGLGPVVAYRAMSRCIDLADQAGLAMTTVRNSNHYGIAGYYAMMALPDDMIGISLTNSQPLVAPTFGKNVALGTNPIAVAIPAGTERPYVLDMATSIVSIGKIVVHDKAGVPIPEGWAINQEGELTHKPAEVLNNGALLPLGGPAELRGYKGYGLSLLVDLLSGVLSGAAYGMDVGAPSSTENANVGHFFAAVKIENFRPVDDFKTDMDRYIRKLKATEKLPGHDRIFIHGEKEFELAERAIKTGVPLMPEVVEALEQAGREADVPFDVQPGQ